MARLDLRLLAPIACYVAGFVLFPPAAFTVSDEGLYVAQAVAFADGSRTIMRVDPVTGTQAPSVVSPYPIGTSLVQAPFVRLAGWRAAAWVSVLALAGTVLILGAWLRDTGSNPAFALMFLAYAPALVIGRIAMSDVPAGCIVAAGLWMLWQTENTGTRARFTAGALLALGLMFRETTVLVWAPFVVSAVWRRERHWKAMTAGVMAGVAARLVASMVMYGSPLQLRDAGAGFSLAAAPDNAVFYAIVLCTLVPGGLIGVVLYRGPRRAEILSAFAMTLALFTFYNYRGASSSWAEQIILGPRLLMPLLPLVVIACAVSFPRLLDRALPQASSSGRLHRFGQMATAALCVASFAVHPVVARRAGVDASIVRAIYTGTPHGAVIIHNRVGAQKVLNPVYGVRTTAFRDEHPVQTVPRIVARNAETYIVFVDRDGSNMRRDDARDNAAYLAQAEGECSLVPTYNHEYLGIGRLGIWKVVRCPGSCATGR